MNRAIILLLLSAMGNTICAQTDTSLNGLDTVELLQDFKVLYKKKDTEVARFKTLKVEQMNQGELKKAACCNLSESFETSPSVDVSFTDAITGTKQIEMLGLSGIYTQISRENMPDSRGLTAISGLSYTPGSWIESIQVSKGAGSVVNGFEGIAGQINVELLKPEKGPKFFLNLYSNEHGMSEGNLVLSRKIKKKWATSLLTHANIRPWRRDQNKDGFMDSRVGRHLVALNRWKYSGENLRIQMGIKGLEFEHSAGQMEFEPASKDPLLWGMHNEGHQIGGWVKIGKLYQEKGWLSQALQLSASNYREDNILGQHRYSGSQNNLYANLIHQSIIGNTTQKYKAGASLLYDDYREDFNDSIYTMTETVPGIFYEHTYSPNEKASIILGLRADYHNHYGLFTSPRLHLRYELPKQWVFRASGGRGLRTARIFTDYKGYFLSSRQVNIEKRTNYGYGLAPEIAWNYGMSLTKKFKLDFREGLFSIDLYRSHFEDQVIADLYTSARTLSFYNLKGKSYSNSIQAQVDYELIRKLDLRLAYRWLDVKMDYQEELKDKPLQSEHRFFVNLAYQAKKEWKFDYTFLWQGSKKLPGTQENPAPYQREERSPSFFAMNAQVSKSFKNKIEMYTGVENLLNYKQENPIIAVEDPNGAYFDSALVWGPIVGRKIYLGLRYEI